MFLSIFIFLWVCAGLLFSYQQFAELRVTGRWDQIKNNGKKQGLSDSEITVGVIIGGVLAVLVNILVGPFSYLFGNKDTKLVPEKPTEDKDK